MNRIIICCAIVVLAFRPFTAHADADLIDTIRDGVAEYPALSSKAIEILDKISKSKSPDEQEGLKRQWEADYKEEKAKADGERRAAIEKRPAVSPAAMRAAVLAACIKIQQRKVYTGFKRSDDGASLQFLDRGHGAYRSTQFEYKAVPDDPLNGKWMVYYPKLEVIQSGSPERLGYYFVEQKASTCTVTEDQLISYLTNVPGAAAPWARD